MCTCRFISLAVIVLLSSSHPVAAAPQTAALQRLNGAFRTLYKSSRDAAMKTVTPVLIAFSSDRLVLHHKGARREAFYVPEEVNTLKTFAHVPLAIYATLLPESGRPLGNGGHKTLQDFSAQLAAAPGDWQHLGISDEQKSRQQKILQASLVMCNDVLQRGSVSRAQLEAFAHEMRPLIYANVHDAARANIDAMHRQTMTWRAELGEDAWHELHVVVLGSHMARRGEITLQYFMHMLRETHEGGRVIFADGVWDEAQAMELLGTHVLDNTASQAFFDDATRLHRDIMADAARDYLNVIDTGAPQLKGH